MGDMPTQHEITPDDHRLLRFEERHPARGLQWEAAIFDELGLTQPTYYRRLFALVARTEVVAGYPQVASRTLRLQAVNANRRRARSRVRQSV